MNNIELLEAINEYSFDGNDERIIDILNTLFDSGEYQEHLNIVFDAISITQMYGFLAYLTDEERTFFLKWDNLRSDLYSGKRIDFYNSGQLSLIFEFEQHNKVFLSAPTSFGKTSIVIEYILNNKDKLDNIVFVVPTNSLLEELFEKFSHYNIELNLGYLISTQPVYSLFGRNVLILTPERFVVMAESKLLETIDLMVMDETYKIVDSHNDSISDFVNHRALRFRKVADIIAKSNCRVIFLSPFTYSLTDSMSAFLSKHDIKKIDRKLEYVKREIVQLDSSDDAKRFFGKQLTYYRRSSSIPQKSKLILSKLQSSSSIVYVPNYVKAYDIADAIDFSCLKKDNDARYIAFMNHLSENFILDGQEEVWAVYEALKKGIGIYISPLPRYVKKEIIRLYENKVLSTLIVTSAFTEGVNTCASNLIFTSLVNGPNTNKLSDIDVLNVSGRAGRFAKNTVGRVFCVNADVYNRVKSLQEQNNIRLENYNYCKGTHRLDYEIEMMDEEYLNDGQREQLQKQILELGVLGLSKSDLNISLNVSNAWKIILYKHFLSLDKSIVKEINDKITNIYGQEEGKQLDALSYLFKDLREAFLKTQINVFPQEVYDIYPFDKSGEFTWGRLYQIYVSGSPKKIILNNINFIKSKFDKITNKVKYLSKEQGAPLFSFNNASWILGYLKNDLSLNMNAFYTETFKIVSNIIQYKIPFYLTFYVSIFKLFIKKNKTIDLDYYTFDINKLISIFENGRTEDEYSKLIDYGLPLTTVSKIADNKIGLDDLKRQKFDQSKFDDYEKMIISETVRLI